MKIFFFLSVCLMVCYCTYGQTRVIRGKIIGSEFPSEGDTTKHEFWDLYGAKIFGNDSINLGIANKKGEFELEIPANIQTLRIGWIGMYPEEFELTGNCEFFEIIMLPDAIYDFVTLKKEQRLRKKDRKVLPDLYKKAYEQGIFKNKEPCR